MFRDVTIVDFSGGRFLTAGIVAHLKIGDFIPGHVHIGNQVALGDLLMVQIIEYFAGGTAHRPADLIGLGYFGQEQTGMIAPGIERFQHHNQSGRFTDFGTPFQVFNDIGGLIIPFHCRIELPGHHGSPAGIDTPGHFHSVTHLFLQHFPNIRLIMDKGFLTKFRISDKNAHGHVRLTHGGGNFFLNLNGTPHHAVIFHGPETDLMHEF